MFHGFGMASRERSSFGRSSVRKASNSCCRGCNAASTLRRKCVPSPLAAAVPVAWIARATVKPTCCSRKLPSSRSVCNSASRCAELSWTLSSCSVARGASASKRRCRCANPEATAIRTVARPSGSKPLGSVCSRASTAAAWVSGSESSPMAGHPGGSQGLTRRPSSGSNCAKSSFCSKASGASQSPGCPGGAGGRAALTSASATSEAAAQAAVTEAQSLRRWPCGRLELDFK
mmetsp:Transcript_144484/g.402522  ORF Transcript_144484/g.402522 Transcript_144484/m.402522 type:complete len:232 (-) Transcript_144484:203-898(-)